MISIDESDLRDILNELKHLRAQRDMLHVKSTAQTLALQRLCETESKLSAQVAEFMCAFDQPQNEKPTTFVRDERVRLRVALVIEEAFEFALACSRDNPQLERAMEEALAIVRKCEVNVDLPSLADACADLDYVVEGARLTFGINGRPIADAVHAANMAKVGGLVDEHGKKRKPVGWQPPDVAALLRAQGWEG